MTKRADDALFFDMLTHAEEALSFCHGLDESSFVTNRQVRWAVIKLIQVVGEASIQVSDSTRVASPLIPWKELRAMRNVLVHQYHDIDDTIVWKTVTDDLPGLVKALRTILKT